MLPPEMDVQFGNIQIVLLRTAEKGQSFSLGFGKIITNTQLKCLSRFELLKRIYFQISESMITSENS
jgi:hypothetical protein